MLAAQPAAFLEVALEELAPFGGGLGWAEAVLVLLGADGGQGVVEGFVGIAHRLMISVVPVGGIIHLGRLQGAIKGPVWCASTGRARLRFAGISHATRTVHLRP